MKDKIKVILIQEILQSYREPIYRIMKETIDLTLAYTVRSDIKSDDYKIIKLPCLSFGPFHIHRNFYQILNNYDVVVLQPHLNCITLNSIVFFPRKFKLVTWTIGVHVTYDTPYDLTKKPSLKDWWFQLIQDRADSCIFYMPSPINYWKKYMNIDESKYFVAHNTVQVADFDKLPSYNSRKSFLFVGSLYRQKGIGELIEAYRMAYERNKSIPLLNIIGKGPEQDSIKNQIDVAGLSEKIFLRGPIYDENTLKDYFLDALLCISPKQAGLSVPKSLGYGCPFVTRIDAITGGERDNIIDGYNGFYYNSIAQLSEILLETCCSPEKFEKMSKNSRDYYQSECHPRIMAQGAIDAIYHSMNN